jgi:dienelactone hydrolase
MKRNRPILFCLAAALALTQAARPAAQDQMAPYFAAETARIATHCLSEISSQADWQARRAELRRQAAEMLGLDPMPNRSDLKPVVSGLLEREDFTVEKLSFQSLPHLYVTANLYLPKGLAKPAPAILYLCGHSRVVTNGVCCGNKTAYQHHGIWFARNGYVCLMIDSLQWGEIEGHHRGTYSEGMWWWNARGYTPAGVETWNGIRALDYLISRPEVDASRLGVTGRSGGGAYSWFLSALDDRVKVAAPVAGLTDLQNYVVDGAVDGHCDCMFMVNTYRWDYPMLAALCAPRPLLLENSDADTIFPLSGVLRTRAAVKQVYDGFGASTNFGLVIAPGPHQDTQELQTAAFRWFNAHLKGQNTMIDTRTGPLFSPLELKAFDQIPADQINTVIQETFVPAAPPPPPPSTPEAWGRLREAWMKGLREKCFAGWPSQSSPPPVTRLASRESDGLRYETYEIQSQPEIALHLSVVRKADGSKPTAIVLKMAVDLEAADVRETGLARAAFVPRGEERTQTRRRFMLLGQTLDGMRVWDIRRAIQALRTMAEFHNCPLRIEADGNLGVDALYASLFEDGIAGLDLRRIPSSHRDGPDYLNVLKILDIPQAVVMGAEHCAVRLEPARAEGWEFADAMSKSAAVKLKLEFRR